MALQITRDKFLSKEERSRLVKATEEKAIVDLALFSGLRVSEMANLTIGDLRLNGSEKLIYVKNGKGDKSGYVTIDKALAKHLKEFISWKKAAGESVESSAPLLTGLRNGRPYSVNALQKEFKQAAEKCRAARSLLNTLLPAYLCYLSFSRNKES